MAAQFKSNVRLREEKGFGSVSLKRLIFSGVGAVLVFMTLRFTPLSAFALPALIGVFAALLILSGTRGGLPLWQRWLLGLRGDLVLAAARDPQGIVAQVASGLNIDPGVVRLRAQVLFAARMRGDAATTAADWSIYHDLSEAETGQVGLRFMPLESRESSESA